MVIAEVMKALRPERRENVVYIDNGRVYVNRPHLRTTVEFPAYVGSRIYQWSDGETFVAPEPEPEVGPQAVTVPGCETQIGAFHRIYTKPGTEARPYTEEAAEAWLPSNLANPQDILIKNPKNETAFLLLGGWGDTGDAVDAGVIYKPSNDSWYLYLKAEGQGIITGTVPLSNRDIYMVFTVGSGYVTLWFGFLESRTAYVTKWRADGIGNRFKRTTSIAQAKQNYTSGSYFWTWWRHTSVGSLPYWQVSDTEAECRKPPENVRTDFCVANFCYSPYDGYVCIDLRRKYTLTKCN